MIMREREREREREKDDHERERERDLDATRLGVDIGTHMRYVPGSLLSVL